MCKLFLAAFVVLALAASAQAQSELQKALKDTDIAPHWIYDDLPKARAAAAEAKKPLLVVLRCVPCPPGKTLDNAVKQPNDELKALEDQFVCVRVIQTNGLDLKLFQLDFDNSWSAVFMNADGTIYGRFGTRTKSGPQSDPFHNVPAFKKAMQRALEVHRGYPGNKESLAGKIGGEPEYPVPEKTPGLERYSGPATTPQGCIHCHMVKEFALRAKWEQKRLALSDLLVYPMPDNLGITIDEQDGAKIASVRPASVALRAGLKAGDELVRLNGQPLVSIADMQWVLHNLPQETKLKATVKRDGKHLDLELPLSGKWKESDIAWRASSWYGLRLGLKTEPLAAADKEQRGIGQDELALVVKGMYGKGAAPLQKTGMRVGDIIVAVDGNSANQSESQFLIDLRLRHGPGDSVKFTMLRGDKRVELTVPMW